MLSLELVRVSSVGSHTYDLQHTIQALKIMFCREKLEHKACGKPSFPDCGHLAQLTLSLHVDNQGFSMTEEMEEWLNAAKATRHLQTHSSLFLQSLRGLSSLLLMTRIPYNSFCAWNWGSAISAESWTHGL